MNERSKRKILSIVLCIASISMMNAQVGVMTTSPVETLDVNGDVILRGPLRLGGSDANKGNAGVAGQILQLDQSGKMIWDNVTIGSVIRNGYYLYNSHNLQDEEGVLLTNADNVTGTGDFEEGASIEGWTVLNNLEYKLVVPQVTPSSPVTKPLNRILLKFETGAQQSTTTGNVQFIVGIFIDGKLTSAVLSKMSNMLDSNYPYLKVSMQDLSSGLTPGEHKIQIAVRRISSSTSQTTLAVGTSVPAASANFSPFMMKSVLQIQTYLLDVD